ncbi:MAG TPA: type II toxin-antitoxin system VapC family toxin [bacterium]|nr:type II toxin-antitoxin system VapC family toxin [bacterium]
MKICVDASLVLKWLVPEEGSEKALALYKKWEDQGVSFLAPGLIDHEIGTTLRQKVLRGLLHPDDFYMVNDFYKRLNILLLHPVDLIPKSLAIAATISQPTIYDVSYLLLAKEQNIDFVTADRRFFEAASPLFPLVKLYSSLN